MQQWQYITTDSFGGNVFTSRRDLDAVARELDLASGVTGCKVENVSEERCRIRVSGDFVEALNALGFTGWELLGWIDGPSTMMGFVLKRLLQQPAH